MVSRSLIVQSSLIFFSIIAVSLFRPILFLFLPFVALFFGFGLRLRVTKNVLLLIGSILLMTLMSSLYQGENNNIANNFLSLYLIVPILFLFFSKTKINSANYFSYLIKALTVILLANNLVALAQLIKAPIIDDDAFIGFYGTHGLAMHTLSLVNFIVGIYYFFQYQQHKSTGNLLLFIIFFMSAVLCFYGLGLLIFLFTILIYRISIRSLFKSMLIFFAVVTVLTASLYQFRPLVFEYNLYNVKKALSFFRGDVDESDSTVPRKLLLYKNYVGMIIQDPGIFFLGTGPGTFNSRSYFLLNGDYSRSKLFEKVLGVHDPRYAAKYVHPLWNEGNTVMFMDGTRNEPFSSVISVMAEYGVIIFGLVGIAAYSKYKNLLSRFKSLRIDEKSIPPPEYHFLKFTTIFVFLNLCTDNYLEYPEFILIYILLFKLLESFVVCAESQTQTVNS